MSEYDKQLVIWETGAGKTCGFIGVSEFFKIRENTPINQVYILVKGQNLIDEIKSQLVYKCTSGEYETENVMKSTNESQRKSNISRAIKDFYTITTYYRFAKEISKYGGNRKLLAEKYSGSIFIVDEVHNLRLNILDEDKPRRSKKDINTIRYQQFVYRHLFALFHAVKRSKIMLLTATPMINEPSEVAYIMNLILPEGTDENGRDRQLPTGSKNKNMYDLPENKNATMEKDGIYRLNDLEPYFRGLISYVRALDTGAIPTYENKKIRDITESDGIIGDFVVYPTEMSKEQWVIYQKAQSNPSIVKGNDEHKKDAFGRLLQQISNFVFPDGSTGTRGFNNTDYIKPEGKYYRATKNFKKLLSNKRELRKLSPKFDNIIHLCKKNPGNCWCYSDLVKGSGGILLGLCMEARGFVRFAERDSVLDKNKKLRDKFTVINKSGQRVIKKQLRYAILLSGNAIENGIIIETFNSEQNKNGALIKVLIGSPMSQSGINLSNVLQIHLIGPSWNQSISYQAESRAIRSTSHDLLLEDKRQELISKDENPNMASIDIVIYRHCSVYGNQKTLDIRKYEVSESKDRRNKRILRMMKECAVDCFVNYKRNTRILTENIDDNEDDDYDDIDQSTRRDEDYSSQCDYDVCQYHCFDTKLNKPIDTSSYDVLYSTGEVDKIKELIKSMFITKNILTVKNIYDDIYNTLYEVDNKFKDIYIYLAIEKLVLEFKYFRNTFGYLSYFNETGGILFLQSDKTSITYTQDNFQYVYYSENNIYVNDTSVSKVIGLDAINKIEPELSKLWDIDVDIKSNKNFIDKTLSNLNIDALINIIEKTIYYIFIKKVSTEAMNYIYEKYQNFVFELHEPVEFINDFIDIIEQPVLSTVGRHFNDPRKSRTEDYMQLCLMFDDDENSSEELVYIHYLYNKQKSTTRHSETTKIKKISYGDTIRILKESESSEWRNVNEYEFPIYANYITSRNVFATSTTENLIYGFSNDGKFRLIDMRNPENKELNGRTTSRGRVCTTFNTNELLEKLDFLYDGDLSFLPSKYTKGVLCTYIKRKLEEDGLIIE